MHPRNRMERGLALHAIADSAEQMEKAGANNLEVTNFIIGAKEELSKERPDLDSRAKAATAAMKWADANKN